MLTGLMLTLRTLLTLTGALALLFTLSYPDMILPPDPNVQDIQYVNIYDFKPVIWLVPLLLMELVCGWGPRRNVTWFGCLVAVWVGGIIAWPVLLCHAPEWVEPTLPFEDGKLPVGLGYMAIIIFGSVLFRCVLLAFLFKEPRNEDSDPTMMDADVLDPAKGLTVQQIRANPPRSNPHFLFGDADHTLIARFMALMAHLRRLKLLHRLVYVLAAVAVALWFWLYPRPTRQQALQRDLALMYEHRALPGGGFLATHRAVHAAYRVMQYVSEHESFAGMSPEQALRWLHIERAPAAYRRQLTESSDITLPSVDDLYESRTRFFTVQDGRRIAVLYIRTNADGDVINVAEVQDAGWNAVADERRRIFGRDIPRRAIKN